MTKSKFFLTLLTLLTFSVGTMWAKTVITYDSAFDPALPTVAASANTSATAHTVEGLAIKEAGLYKGASATYIMFKQDAGYLYNTADLGSIAKVTATYSSGCSTSAKTYAYFGSSEQSTYKTSSNATIPGVSQTSEWESGWSRLTNTHYGYFQLSSSKKNCQITQIEIYYNNKINIADVTGGYRAVKLGSDFINDEDYITEGTELTVDADATGDYVFDSVKIVKTSTLDDVTTQVYNQSTHILTMPDYEITLYVVVSPAYMVTYTSSSAQGDITVTKGGAPVSTGDRFREGDELEVIATANPGWRLGTIQVQKSSDYSDVTDAVYSNGTITMPNYDIDINATYDELYDINVVASGGDVAIEVNGSPATQAAAGDHVYVVATADGTHVFQSLTLSDNITSSDIDQNEATFDMPNGEVTVTATFTESTEPAIAVQGNITSWDFGTVKKGDPATSKSIMVSGINLEPSTTVYFSTSDDQKFTVDVDEVEVANDGTLPLTEVTITPITTAAMNVAGTEYVVIYGGGLSDNVMIYLSIVVQETYTVDWIVNGNSIYDQTDVAGTDLLVPSDPIASGDCAGKVFRGWLAEELPSSTDVEPTNYVNTTGLKMPAANTSYYAVFATQEGEDFSATFFKETFDACTGTGANDGSWSGAIASETLPAGLASDGWTIVQGKAAKQCIKLGSGDNGGSAQTPEINLQGKSTAHITFKAASWNGNSEKTTLSLATSTGKLDKASVSMTKGAWTVYDVTLTKATENPKITFSTDAGNSRFFLDSVVVWVETHATYSEFVTSCPHCENVGITIEPAEHGSIELQIGGVAVVPPVKVCDAPVVMDVVATPESGYKLENVELGGDTEVHATYANNQITIPVGGMGLLIVTPSFGVATALINTSDDLNVVKTIENGQLVIIKNGIRYNAQGNVLK